MTKVEKKLIIDAITQTLVEGGIKDFMTGAITYIWNPRNKKGQYSIYKVAEDIFKALNLEILHS